VWKYEIEWSKITLEQNPLKSKSDVTNAIVVQQIWPHQTQSVEHRIWCEQAMENGKIFEWAAQSRKQNQYFLFSLHVEHGEMEVYELYSGGSRRKVKKNEMTEPQHVWRVAASFRSLRKRTKKDK
jgi:hypothetical protein